MKILTRTYESLIQSRQADGQAMNAVVSDYGDGWIEVDTKHPQYPRRSRARAAADVGIRTRPAIGGGPGSELHALLQDWLGVKPTADCPCRSMAAKMDTRGPDWCESDDGMAEILGVMRAEHAKRWAAGTTILPWTDVGARQLVLLACRRARAKAAPDSDSTASKNQP
jgi:hypothetical protein